MRQIKTENGQYTIADNRNIEEFIKQLKKPKNPAKRAKAEKRFFPVFFAGQTSTRDYVRQYYERNNLNGNQSLYEYLDGLFGPLSDNPAPDFAVEDDVIEVRVC
jgi:hypothetical protein